jgi:hypothetical protein
MTNEKRLAIALENLLREHTSDSLKELCNRTVDELVKTLPREFGGTKVSMEVRSCGKGSAQLTAPKHAVGSLSINSKD